jgi:hypothetical protein
MARKQLRLVFGNLRELALNGFSNPSMQRATRLAQQRSIGRILD